MSPRRVAADAGRTLVHEREVAPHLVGAGLVRDVAVGQPAGPEHRFPVVAAEQDRRSAGSRRLRGHLHAVVRKGSTLEREPAAGPRSPQDLDGLLGPGAAFGLRRAEHPELLLAPPVAETEEQPAARQEVDDGRVLGESQRVVERREHDAGPELDPLGHRGERREQREHRRQITVRRTVVLAHPRGVEPDAFGQAHELERLPVLLPEGSFRARRELGREQPDADADAHRRDVTRRSSAGGG